MSPKPSSYLHQCPKCLRHVLVTVPATAWCVTCGARMRIVQRPHKPRGTGTDNPKASA